MRLIDADDFKIDVDERGFDFFVSETDLDTVKKMIDEQTTVDAVPVVRCKDCEYLEMSDFCGECGKAILGIVSPRDFCSRGMFKRKKKGEDR